ncbi:MAG: AAA family ATPase, partial [Chloroflexi bacterium]|nr:AAA family ATPase [Chloroflexota bacterium]
MVRSATSAEEDQASCDRRPRAACPRSPGRSFAGAGRSGITGLGISASHRFARWHTGGNDLGSGIARSASGGHRTTGYHVAQSHTAADNPRLPGDRNRQGCSGRIDPRRTYDTHHTDKDGLPVTTFHSNGHFESAQQSCEAVLETVAGVFVGNRVLLRKVLAAALANGHVLFEDYPGLGKTLLAKVFARSIGCGYTRVQFTPDLLPADILGTKVWRQGDGAFQIVKGPIFTRVLLADEVNRAPPKTQSALLEAMEERQVT